MASTDRPRMRYMMPHDFFPPKQQECNHHMEDEDDVISDFSSDCSYCCSDCSYMEDEHVQYYSWEPKAPSKESNSSLLAQATASPTPSDPSDQDQLHSPVTDYDSWSTHFQLDDLDSRHYDRERTQLNHSFSSPHKLLSPSHSSLAVEDATTPQSDPSDSWSSHVHDDTYSPKSDRRTPSPANDYDSDSDESCFTLPSGQYYSCPSPTTTPFCDPLFPYYGPFSPTNTPTPATPLYDYSSFSPVKTPTWSPEPTAGQASASNFDCNICFEMARKPVVTSCGHLYCSLCLYKWLNYYGGRECTVCMSNVSESLITPICSSINSGFKVPPCQAKPKGLRV